MSSQVEEVDSLNEINDENTDEDGNPIPRQRTRALINGKHAFYATFLLHLHTAWIDYYRNATNQLVQSHEQSTGHLTNTINNLTNTIDDLTNTANDARTEVVQMVKDSMMDNIEKQ